MAAKLLTMDGLHDMDPGSTSFETAFGWIAVSWSQHGITRVGLHAARPAIPSTSPPTTEPVASAVGAIRDLLSGQPRDLREIELDHRRCGAFERRVYDAARAIDPGETRTYGEIATAIGAPGEAREVGAALARNPFLIVVPCHRVIAADGGLRGFSAPGGIETKRRLLALEGAPVAAERTLFDLAPQR